MTDTIQNTNIVILVIVPSCWKSQSLQNLAEILANHAFLTNFVQKSEILQDWYNVNV